MCDNYVLAKALALYTGSRSLLTFMDFVNNSYCSDEVFRCIKRMIIDCLPEDSRQLQNNIPICVTKYDVFYQVSKILLIFIVFQNLLNIKYLDLHNMSMQ